MELDLLNECIKQLRSYFTKECMVCYRELECEFGDDGNISNIHDIVDVKSDRVFISCCLNKDHVICKECLRTLALSFDNHMINKSSSMMFCPATTGCLSAAGTLNFFNHNLIQKILSHTEFLLYSEHADRYAFPGFEVVKCRDCFKPNVIPQDDFTNAGSGGLIIRCVQSYYCGANYCYTCKRDVDEMYSFCHYCESKTENTNPAAFNRYFYKPEEYRVNHACEQEKYFFRNYELTNDIIINQLNEVISEPYVRCPVCLVKIYKTEQCNGMDHCGTEFCYVCNRKAIGKLGDHWSEEGRRGCYRFDSSQLIKNLMRNYKCSEGYCFGHTIGDCKELTHQQGLKDMSDFRTFNLVYHMLKSITPEQRDDILEIISLHHHAIDEYTTCDFDYNNYFDYLPPVKLKFYNRFDSLVERPSQSINISLPLIVTLPPPVPLYHNDFFTRMNTVTGQSIFDTVISYYTQGTIYTEIPQEVDIESDGDTIYNPDEEYDSDISTYSSESGNNV